jgi:predicted protein tyrosine phosphatase
MGMPIAFGLFDRNVDCPAKAARRSMETWTPNFNWITPQLAVGGSVPARHAQRLATEHRIRAVVDLRGEVRDDEADLRRHGIALLHLPTVDMCGVAPAHLDQGVAFANAWLARGERVLIHCEHGIGRSATLALCVMVCGGDAPLDALERMKTRRALVSPSPEQFASWCEWLARHRRQQRAGWRVPDFDAFQAIAYRHLRTG